MNVLSVWLLQGRRRRTANRQLTSSNSMSCQFGKGRDQASSSRSNDLKLRDIETCKAHPQDLGSVRAVLSLAPKSSASGMLAAMMFPSGQAASGGSRRLQCHTERQKDSTEDRGERQICKQPLHSGATPLARSLDAWLQQMFLSPGYPYDLNCPQFIPPSSLRAIRLFTVSSESDSELGQGFRGDSNSGFRQR